MVLLSTIVLNPVHPGDKRRQADATHSIDVSTVAGRRQAYSRLLSRGLIRIAVTVR
jgi:hypothetical protein